MTAAGDFIQQARLSTEIPGDEYALAGVGVNGVAVSGNTAVVSSAAGAYVYIRTGAAWTQQALLVPNDGVSVLEGSPSIAIDGDTAVLGGRGAGINGNASQGAVYVFVRNGTSWILQQRLTASDGTTADTFGRSVSINGETILVGAPQNDVGVNIDQGSAYVFVRNGEVWTEQAMLTAADGDTNNYFGFGVAIDQDTAVISRAMGNNTATIDPAVYVFVRNGTIWSQQQKLSFCDPSGNGNQCNFGSGIAIKGNRLVVGNRFLNVGNNRSQGGVYVFERSGANWTVQQKIIAGDGQPESYFGRVVTITDDRIIIGSPGYAMPGSAYIFTRSGEDWVQRQKLLGAGGFGESVAVSGGTLIVASGTDTQSSGRYIGAAYVYVSETQTPTPTPTPTTSPTSSPTPIPVFAEFTKQTRLATGNVNDGFADSGVDISGNTAVISSPAGVYVFTGSGTAWTQQALLVPSDGLSGCVSGPSVGIEIDTIVFGCQQETINGNSNQGAAYVFIRNGSTWTEQQRLTASDGTAFDQFGAEIAISGETILVASPLHDKGVFTNDGAAYVFVRSGGRWTEQAILRASDAANNKTFGWRIALDDNTAVISNLPGPSAGPVGHVYVFARNGNTWLEQANLSVCENFFGVRCYFGYDGLAVHGDVLSVGNPVLMVEANEAQGGIYIFSRSGSSWTQQQRLVAADGLAHDTFGNSAAIRGSTLVVGASADGGFSGTPGKAYVYNWTGTEWTLHQKIMAGQNGNSFGKYLSLDAASLIVAAPTDVRVSSDFTGAAYIFTEPTASTRESIADFDGDGKSDVSVWRESSGIWFVNASGNSSFTPFQFGQSEDKIVPGDYDGDGKANLAVYRPDGGLWYLHQSDNGFSVTQWGASTDIPVPGDYDGDGKTDIAVWRPSSGVWFVRNSGNGQTVATQYGQDGDRLVPGDYDGDGKTDFAVWRQASGIWFIRKSSGGETAVQFGQPTDKVVPADYDGDGKTDLAVYREGNLSLWYIFPSTASAYTVTQWGTTDDVPVPGDYDGDGKADISVWRPSNGIWFMQRSTSGFLATQFGQFGDKPVPAAYMPLQ